MPPSFPAQGNGSRNPPSTLGPETSFGHPMDFFGNRFVYVVISPRARGLSIGVNLNPDKKCNFDCIYCEVNRALPGREARLDVKVLARELGHTFSLIQSGRLRDNPWYRNLPEELLQLRHLTLSGDGEPTMTANFSEAAEEVLHLRALGNWPFFKIVLVTNATGLNRPEVIETLDQFTASDEIWAKLDGGTQAHLDAVNRPDVPIEVILSNILHVAHRRPVVLQSLFPAINGAPPTSGEIAAYVQRLRELKEGGAQISLVQIYSATRPTHNPVCGHLPLRVLSGIAQMVRSETGLRAEVF